VQAAKAIGRTDVFFLLDKGEAKDSMIELRRRLLKAYARPGRRLAEGRDPTAIARRPTTPARSRTSGAGGPR
jgi:hypothetical protein